MILTHWSRFSMLPFVPGPNIQSNHKSGSEEFKPFPRNCIWRKFQIRWKSDLCGWGWVPSKIVRCQLQVSSSCIQGPLKVLQNLSLEYEVLKSGSNITAVILFVQTFNVFCVNYFVAESSLCWVHKWHAWDFTLGAFFHFILKHYCTIC
jgi:hypothetical protein